MKNKSINIFVVEDNEDDIHFIKRALEGEKYHLTIFNDGNEGFQFLCAAEEMPDIVLLDYHLPSMDGLEFLNAVKEKGLVLAVIVLTVDTRVETAVKVMKAGALDFLPKTTGFHDNLPATIEKVNRIFKERIEKNVIKQALRQYVDIVNNMQIGLHVYILSDMNDCNTLKLVDTNPAAEQLLGKVDIDSLGVSVEKVWLNADRKDFSKTLFEVIRSGTPDNFEILLDTESPVHFSIRAFPLPNQHVGVLFEDISRRKFFERTLYRRDAVLEAVNFMARSILRSCEFEQDLHASLQKLGEAIESCRVYILQNTPDGKGVFLPGVGYEWHSDVISPRIRIHDGDSMFYTSGFGRDVYDCLKQGEAFIGDRKTSSPKGKLYMEMQQIQSFIAVPIIVADDWWGFLGFDENRADRIWSKSEIDALQTAAETIAASFQRQWAQDVINASLKEKEVLLQEIHHRVKNNLQIISSLLDLSSLRVNDQRSVVLFGDARDKIHAMALIHAQLYNSERFDEICMSDHIQDIVLYLLSLYGGKKTISPVFEIDDFHLHINQAIPCSLVVNELVSNSFKHAFNDKASGKIWINIKKNKKDLIQIMVRDNGVGISDPNSVFDGDSMGLKLVKNLVERQLMGSIKLSVENGLRFDIEFLLAGDRRADPRNV
ncbi:response regulator [candidate division KSB1 bacterium]|nr:response regulator [candidate division KSB1 bacterium]